MSEAELAWKLWHVLQLLEEMLWERYESAFMDFCGEESYSQSRHRVMKQLHEDPF